MDWIGRGDGQRGPWVRLGVVAATLFVWSLLSGLVRGRLDSDWWAAPFIAAIYVFLPFCLWRFLDRRRRAAQARDKAVQRLDLG